MYVNGVLLEGLLCVWELIYKEVFVEVVCVLFEFLLDIIFVCDEICVVFNKNWLYKGEQVEWFGEQLIDVVYIILVFGCFYVCFGKCFYFIKMKVVFDWFIGKNYLCCMIYQFVIGGCMDGLEEYYVNLNQGVEFIVSYLLVWLEIVCYVDEMEFLLEEVVDEILEMVKVLCKIWMMLRYYNLFCRMEEKFDFVWQVIGFFLFCVVDDQDL